MLKQQVLEAWDNEREMLISFLRDEIYSMSGTERFQGKIRKLQRVIRYLEKPVIYESAMIVSSANEPEGTVPGKP